MQRVGRIAGVRDGRPVTVDGDVLDPQTVVWCTGYRPDYSWIDLPVSDASGHPIMERGVSPETGLYFIGLEFQYAAASATIQGLDQDARYLLRAMASTAAHGMCQFRSQRPLSGRARTDRDGAPLLAYAPAPFVGRRARGWGVSRCLLAGARLTTLTRSPVGRAPATQHRPGEGS